MAKTTDELFAEATEADYETAEPVTLAASDTEEEFQFRIDEHLRTIAIPEKGVVAGVEGDLNVNIARFTMTRYYHGRDLSKLNIRINYRNANGQVNYYTVSDATISGDSIVFSWEYAADVTQYKGNVQFVVYLFSATSAVLKQKFFTTLGTLEVLEGLEVDSSIPVSEQTDILLHLKKDLSAYAEEVKKSLPADYTAMTEQVNSLKEDLKYVNSAMVRRVSKNIKTIKSKNFLIDDNTYNDFVNITLNGLAKQNGVPTPTAPIDIVGVNGGFELKSLNLISDVFRPNDKYISDSLSYSTKGSIEVKPHKAYCFYVECEEGLSNDGAIYGWDKNGNKVQTALIKYHKNNTKYCRLITDETVVKVSFYCMVGPTGGKNVRLTIGYDIKEYSASEKESIVNVGANLYSLPDGTCDTIEYKNGKTIYTKKLHYQKIPIEAVTKSSYSNRYIVNGNYLDYPMKRPDSESANILCTHLSPITPSSASDNGVAIATNNNITFGYNSSSTLDEFKAAFADAYILYEMAEYIEADIDADICMKPGATFVECDNLVEVTYENVIKNTDVLKGVNCTITANSNIDTLKEYITSAYSCGANSVAFVISNVFESSTGSTLVELDTSILTNLATLIDFCNLIGMYVTVRCTCYAKNIAGGENIIPDDVSSWFSNWYERVCSIMNVAYPLGVRTVSVSNELKNLNNQYADYWYSIVKKLHNAYDGLEVAINFNIYAKDISRSVLNQFDIIGFNCYPCLTRKGLDVSDTELKSAMYCDIYTDNNVGKIEELLSIYRTKKYGFRKSEHNRQ